jgi:hypothetical protein
VYKQQQQWNCNVVQINNLLRLVVALKTKCNLQVANVFRPQPLARSAYVLQFKTIIKIIMADLMKRFKDEFVKKDFPAFRAGDTITVYYEIKEGEKLEHSFQRSCYPKKRFW